MLPLTLNGRPQRRKEIEVKDGLATTSGGDPIAIAMGSSLSSISFCALL
jgi:hypothetical protein